MIRFENCEKFEFSANPQTGANVSHVYEKGTKNRVAIVYRYLDGSRGVQFMVSIKGLNVASCSQFGNVFDVLERNVA